MTSDDDRAEAPASGNDAEAALHELALRLISPQYGASDPSTGLPCIWPGRLPDVLPFDLPIPDTARVIGSYGGDRDLTALIDADSQPKQIVAFYTDRLRASGWSTLQAGHDPGGFIPPQLAQQAQALFCRSTDGPAMTVFAQVAANGTTHATLSINLDPVNNPCRQTPDHEPPERSIGPQLPPLEPPAGCDLYTHGMSTGPHTSATLATLTTQLDLAAVVHHYGRQLEEAGWRADESGQSGPVAWSAWDFVDRDRSPARGVFVTIQEPGETGRYALYLHAAGKDVSRANGEK
jgi:hypothetical protein